MLSKEKAFILMSALGAETSDKQFLLLQLFYCSVFSCYWINDQKKGQHLHSKVIAAGETPDNWDRFPFSKETNWDQHLSVSSFPLWGFIF